MPETDLIFDPALACWGVRFVFTTTPLEYSAGLTPKTHHAHSTAFCTAYADPFVCV